MEITDATIPPVTAPDQPATGWQAVVKSVLTAVLAWAWGLAKPVLTYLLGKVEGAITGVLTPFELIKLVVIAVILYAADVLVLYHALGWSAYLYAVPLVGLAMVFIVALQLFSGINCLIAEPEAELSQRLLSDERVGTD